MLSSSVLDREKSGSADPGSRETYGPGSLADWRRIVGGLAADWRRIGGGLAADWRRIGGGSSS